MKKRACALLLTGALGIGLLGGCGANTQSTDQTAQSGETRDELVFVNYRDIRDLNPHLYAGEMYAQSILYDTLVSSTAEGYEGCLAEDWTVSEDGRIYTFNIRD